VAALALGIEQCQFEGQAAMLLEAACDASACGEYEIHMAEGECRVLDWRPLVREVLRDRAAGVAPGVIAMRFHRGVAGAVCRFCRGYDISLPVVLSGGVFQNRVLVELVAQFFSQRGQPLGLPGRIPVNDGGLAAGQLAAAAMGRHWSRQACV
jgi:hydrogenase maturation protein HypF